MKRKWKIILVSLLVVIIGSGATLYYLLNGKTYETADEKVEEITNSEYDIVLPADEDMANEPAAADSDKEKVEGQPTGKTDSSSPTTHSDGNKGSSQTKAPSSNVTVASIKGQYEPVFQSLQAQAESKASQLVSYAYNEYITKKKNDESVSIGYFYQKYTEAADALEDSTDSAFQSVYTSLQGRLKKYGFSPEEATSFKEQYEAEKKARKSTYLEKAKSAF